MNLKPKIGIDNLKFGMSQKEIYEILGMPNRKRIDEDDENQLFLEFNDEKIRLTIYQDENKRLGYIRTINPNIEYNGHKIINSTLEYAQNQIFGEIIKEWEIDDYEFFTTYGNDEFWLTLNVEYGIIISLEIGVPFKNDEEYDWPK